MTALVAMSGGVDSAVAASLLREAGHECVGVTLIMTDGMYAEAEMAKKTCDALGMAHRTVDARARFRDTVIADFISQYEKGGTPNPCVLCNKRVKLGMLVEQMHAFGCDRVATGHYARIERDEGGRPLLLRAADETKDQSYMLWRLSQEELSLLLLPLGDKHKADIRAYAREKGLPVHDRSDSQDICFIPDGDYAAFIERETGKKFPCGDFCTEDGRVLGTHRGIIRYTVGQRKGLGLALSAPLYVKEKHVSTNTVVLTEEKNLYTDIVRADSVNLIDGVTHETGEPFSVSAKVRYAHRAERALAFLEEDGTLTVRFDAPVRAVAKGQSLVLYDGDRLLGGGIIL